MDKMNEWTFFRRSLHQSFDATVESRQLRFDCSDLNKWLRTLLSSASTRIQRINTQPQNQNWDKKHQNGVKTYWLISSSSSFCSARKRPPPPERSWNPSRMSARQFVSSHSPLVWSRRLSTTLTLLLWETDMTSGSPRWLWVKSVYADP